MVHKYGGLNILGMCGKMMKMSCQSSKSIHKFGHAPWKVSAVRSKGSKSAMLHVDFANPTHTLCRFKTLETALLTARNVVALPNL